VDDEDAEEDSGRVYVVCVVQATTHAASDGAGTPSKTVEGMANAVRFSVDFLYDSLRRQLLVMMVKTFSE
jgi:hypothetical protein